MSLLTRGCPSEVEVAGERVLLRCGFRTGLLAEGCDRTAAEGRLRLLWMHFGDDARTALPAPVLAHPAEALAAALAWHDAAWGAVSYGRPRPARARTFDWDADAGIVLADFQRLYGLDLSDPATQVHWHRFVALFEAAVRTEGSLLSAAVSARGPLPPGAGREAQRAHARTAEAWRLPPTEEEMAERARQAFGA